jgi:hypothetical protein
LFNACAKAKRFTQSCAIKSYAECIHQLSIVLTISLLLHSSQVASSNLFIILSIKLHHKSVLPLIVISAHLFNDLTHQLSINSWNALLSITSSNQLIIDLYLWFHNIAEFANINVHPNTLYVYFKRLYNQRNVDVKL